MKTLVSWSGGKDSQACLIWSVEKFRGKRIDNGEWVYGYLIGNDVIVGDIIEFNTEYFNTEFWYKVDPETVGQYTGLIDKNGTKIFEGDILDGHSDGHGVVEWTDFDGGYNYVFDDGNAVGVYEVLRDAKVIGNIHDNPGLIKRGEIK